MFTQSLYDYVVIIIISQHQQKLSRLSTHQFEWFGLINVYDRLYFPSISHKLRL